MKSFFCSWSGGKDSCLSLYKALQKGGTPKSLLTLLDEEGERSRSHGLSREILHAQSRSLGIPLHTINTSWTDYRDNFIRGIRALKERDGSITHGVFGDIDIEANEQWEREVCLETDLEAYLPLWKMKRRDILRDFLDDGFKAMIIAANSTCLNPKDYLGRTIDKKLIEKLEAAHIDPCGENGEYHTIVFDGPIFTQSLHLKKAQVTQHANYYFLAVQME